MEYLEKFVFIEQKFIPLRSNKIEKNEKKFSLAIRIQ